MTENAMQIDTPASLNLSIRPTSPQPQPQPQLQPHPQSQSQQPLHSTSTVPLVSSHTNNKPHAHASHSPSPSPPRQLAAGKVSLCPFLASSSSSSSSSAHLRCTASSSLLHTAAHPSPPPSPRSQSQSHAHTCPFATAIPSSRQPVYHTLADGTVIETRRRCPLWVRALRFSAKFVAKQVMIRTCKGVLMGVFRHLRAASNNNGGDNDDHETESHLSSLDVDQVDHVEDEERENKKQL